MAWKLFLVKILNIIPTSPNSSPVFNNITKQRVSGIYYFNPKVLVYETASRKEGERKGDKNDFLGMLREEL